MSIKCYKEYRVLKVKDFKDNLGKELTRLSKEEDWKVIGVTDRCVLLERTCFEETY